MINILRKIIGDKKEWKQMEKRAKALPEDYQFVYHKIQRYMWAYPAGSSAGYEIVDIFKDLIDLFEQGAAAGKSILEITGNDVAAFCDELLRNVDTYTEKSREKLNREINEKLSKNE